MKTRVMMVAAVCAMAMGRAEARQWSLRACVDYALAHNIGIRQRENVCQRQQLQLANDRNSRLPNLEASVGQNFSFGRGLSADNTYTNTNTSSTSLNLGTSVPLFTGMRIPNTIKVDRLNLEAATQDLQKAKDDVSVQVARAYVEALYAGEAKGVALRQVAIDSMQVARLEALLANGKASEAELAQQRATLAQSRLTATQAENSRRLALLDLAQLLELPSAEGFDVARPAVDSIGPGTQPVPTAEAVFAEAVGAKAEVVAEQLRLRGTEYGIRVARSAYYPQLSLSAGLGTNYYKTSGIDADALSKQLKNNFSQYVGLSLSVPLFNRFQTRNSVRSAELERDNQQLALDNVRKTLFKEIQQVCCNTEAAAAKLQGSRAAVAGGEAAFRLTKAKYENGKASVTEFNEAKNNMLKAQSDFAQARYEYVYQLSLVAFYRGKPLEL